MGQAERAASSALYAGAEDTVCAICRFLKQVQEDASSDTSTQGTLEQLLGDKLHLGQQINKLLLLEADVYD